MNIHRIEKIFQQYKLLKDLHGSANTKELIKIVAEDMNVMVEEVIFSIQYNEAEVVHEDNIDEEYGLVNMRAQPFHYGHNHILNEILLDGKIPLIILGDDYGKNLTKNPLNFKKRKELIKLIYPNTKIIFVSVGDDEDWNKWWDDIGHQVIGTSGRHVDQITFYYNNKPEDKYDHFSCNGKEYYNEFYTKIFEDSGMKIKQVEFVERNDIKVDAHATNIRGNLEAFKHLLDARVYWKLKEWGW